MTQNERNALMKFAECQMEAARGQMEAAKELIAFLSEEVSLDPVSDDSHAETQRRGEGANEIKEKREIPPTPPKEKRETLSIKNSRARKESDIPFSKPTLDEVRAYCMERGNNIDAEAFVDYYEARGWYIKNHLMRDWQSAVRTWERNQRKDAEREAKMDARWKERGAEMNAYRISRDAKLDAERAERNAKIDAERRQWRLSSGHSNCADNVRYNMEPDERSVKYEF